jgi:hypothetical protein
MTAVFTLALPGKDAVDRAVTELETEGLTVRSWQSWNGEWVLLAEASETPPSVHALEQRLVRLATSLGGAYDGFTQGAQGAG